MRGRYGFLVFILIFAACLSCSPQIRSDEETLLRYVRAARFYSEGRFQETAAVLEGDRDFPPALTLRGKAEFFCNENEKAEKSFLRSLALRSSGTEARLYLARIHREKGRMQEAEALIEAVLQDDPEDIRALRLAADIAGEKGPHGLEAASAFLDRAVEASSETALVFLDRAKNRWIAGNGTAALADLRSAKVIVSEGTALFRAIESLEKSIQERMNRN
jgi:tetratricopeptide (TPR) repeat protein